jgi:hypothetical protein
MIIYVSTAFLAFSTPLTLTYLYFIMQGAIQTATFEVFILLCADYKITECIKNLVNFVNVNNFVLLIFQSCSMMLARNFTLMFF